MLQVNRYNQFHLGDKRGNTAERLALPNPPDSHLLTLLDPMCPLAVSDCLPTPISRNPSTAFNLHIAEFSMLSSEMCLFLLSFQ